MKAEDRVGAILHETEDIIYFLGFGKYLGDFVPETAAGTLAEIAREEEFENPKILLDSGKVVWGCECWWGPEEEVKTYIQGRTIVEVDIDQVRKRFLGRKNANKTPGQNN